MPNKVTDPALLAQLEAPERETSGKVTDPELLAQLEAEEEEQAAPTEEYDPRTDMESPVGGNSFWQNLQEGIGSGMVGGARRMENLGFKAANRLLSEAILPKGVHGNLNLVPTPDIVSDEAIEEQRQIDAPLAATGGGKVGGIVGETAITAPVGGAASSGFKVLGAAARASPTKSLLLRALASKPVQSLVEGSVTAGATSRPGHLVEDAALGGLAGGTMSTAGKLVGKGTQGLIKKSQAAQDLQHIAAQMGEEVDLPLAAAADDKGLVNRLVKALYKEGLPLIPGAGSKLAKQGDEAMEQVRKLVIKEATPEGVTLPANIAKEPGEAGRVLKQAFETKLDDTIRQYDYPISKTLRKDVYTSITSNVKNIDKTSAQNATTALEKLLARFSSGKPRIEGDNILDVKREMDVLISKARGKEKEALIVAKGHLDNMVETKLKTQSPQRLKEFQDLAEPTEQMKVLEKTLEAAKGKGGKFTPSQLARAAEGGSGLELIANAARDTLEQGGGRSSSVGRTIVGAGLGGYGMLIDPTTAAATWLGGNLLAGKRVQKALMGDLKAQKYVAEQLRKHGGKNEVIGRYIRNLVTTQAGDEDE